MFVISSEPKVIIHENVLTREECELIRNSNISFTGSTGYDYAKKEFSASSFRTSSTYYDTENKFKFVTERNFNVAQQHFWFMDFKLENLEKPQIQKYSVGQEFKPHHDYFNHPGQPTVENDRMATVILYLNDNFTGGETYFPELHLMITPKQGTALFFDYKYIQELNFKTLHAGLPPTSGEKWILTSWIRRLPYTNYPRLNNNIISDNLIISS